MYEDEKHLKWRLINKEGLTESQADKRIMEMKTFLKKNKKEKKNK